ncbi:MAG: ribonuclease R family protein [Candidatus Korobacteraceae bacterium]
MLDDRSILRKIEQQPRHTASYKQLARELGVRGEDRRALGESLNRLVSRGELKQVDRDQYALPRSGKNLVAGRLSMHRDGFGFVTPESTELRQQISGDIFISPHAIGSAMHGDRVQLEVIARRDGRAEGRILRVMSRAHATVVGIFHHGRRYNFVTPIDEKVTTEIVIPAGREVPEKESLEKTSEATRKQAAASRHRVLGDEALRREVQPADMEGVVVDVEITDWPTATQNPRGRVVEILGYEDDFGVDVEIIIRKHHIPHRFPAEVLEEAARYEDIIPRSALDGRRDFRNLPIVTIDGETARDFDDAVYVRQLANGNFELQVHIADVAHYVTEGSALDAEARLRGNSVYFPDRAVPMLPLELSTDICSLRPQVERLVMSCLMEIDPRGEVAGFELCPGAIRSAERMTYTNVNLILEGDAGLRGRYQALTGNFELMRDLAMILNRKRERRGSIDFDLPEPVVEFDEFGLMRAITRSERNIAHRIIEEFMLAANECVASYLEQKGTASLYRIHEKPEPRRVLEFEQIAAGFGYSLGVGAVPVKKFRYTDQRCSRDARGSRSGVDRREIEIPEDIHITPRMYQKLAAKLAGKPEERIVSFLMLRSLKQARYSEKNEGHFALAAPTYTHFTSPIRRYPDLIVHRILKEVLQESAERDYDGVPVGAGIPAGSETPSPWSKRGPEAETHNGDTGVKKKTRRTKGTESPAQGESEVIPLGELHDIAENSSQTERRAEEAERELMEWKKVKFMEDRVGEEFDGLIISVTKYGCFVELAEMFIEGLVPLASLEGDRFMYHESTRQIIGARSRKTYSLGDRVRVLLDRIDPVQKKIQFSFVEPPAIRAGKNRPEKKKKGR